MHPIARSKEGGSRWQGLHSPPQPSVLAGNPPVVFVGLSCGHGINFELLDLSGVLWQCCGSAQDRQSAWSGDQLRVSDARATSANGFDSVKACAGAAHREALQALGRGHVELKLESVLKRAHLHS